MDARVSLRPKATAVIHGGVCPAVGLWSGGDGCPAAAEDEGRRLALGRAALAGEVSDLMALSE